MLVNMIEKAAIIKRIEYSLLGKELEAQTSVVEKHENEIRFLSLLMKKKNQQQLKKEEPVTIKKENNSRTKTSV